MCNEATVSIFIFSTILHKGLIMQMINKSFLFTLCICSSIASLYAGKNTAEAFYWLTKGSCYTAGAAVAVGSIPVIACASPVVPVAAPIVGSVVGKSAAIAAIGMSEQLAKKAYDYGMKF